MRKLAELTSMVASWNNIGANSIPPLQLIVMVSNQLQDIKQQLLDTLYGGFLREAPILQENNILQGHEYCLLGPPSEQECVRCNIHVLQGMCSQNIKDQEYKMKKKLITKLLGLQTGIALVLVDREQDRNQNLGMHFINELDFSQKRTIVVERDDPLFSYEKLCRSILEKYLETVRLDIVHAYREMLDMEKKLSVQLEPLRELETISAEDYHSYIVHKHQQFALQAAASLSGTYISGAKQTLGDPKSHSESNIRGRIFEQLFNAWERQSQRISRSIQALPLSQLAQQIQGYNSYSLNGFITAECFKAAFSGYLFDIKQEMLDCMSNINEIVVGGIHNILFKHFRYINARESLQERLVEHIAVVYSHFKAIFEVFVDSQVMCISVSESDFWRINPINTSLYANQILIELKFIGNGYVKRIIEGLKESVPRMVSELYINKLIDGLNQLSFSYLEQAIQGREHAGLIEISPEEVETWRVARKQLGDVKEQIRYFCLKIASHNIISNLNEKIEKYINSVEQSNQEPEQVEIEQDKPKLTFLDRVRLVFGIRKKTKRQTRSASAEKQYGDDSALTNKLQKENDSESSSILAIRQAEWLIAINTNRMLPSQRLYQSAKAGFPALLRPSIWLYICQKDLPKVDVLYQRIDKSSIVYKQIMKDVRRTPPYQFFNGPAKQALETVLVAYSVYDQKVGYTQGMNFIVSFLIRVLIGYEESTAKYVEDSRRNYRLAAQQSFVILSYLINELKWSELYLNGTPRLFQITVQLDDKISKHLPKLFELLQESGLNTSLVFTQALMTIFSAKAPMEFTKRIFDVFLLKGEPAIVSIILKVLRLNQAHIMRIKSQHELFNFLRTQLMSHTFKHYPEIIPQIVSDQYS